MRSRGVVSFIFVVAVLNVCLGFAVAIHLGRRYRAMVAGGDVWNSASGLDWPGLDTPTPRNDALESPEGVEPPLDDSPPPDERDDSTHTDAFDQPTPADAAVGTAAAGAGSRGATSDSAAGPSTLQDAERDAVEEDEAASIPAEEAETGITARDPATSPMTKAAASSTTAEKTTADVAAESAEPDGAEEAAVVSAAATTGAPSQDATADKSVEDEEPTAPTESAPVEATPEDVVTDELTEDATTVAQTENATVDAAAVDAAANATSKVTATGKPTHDATTDRATDSAVGDAEAAMEPKEDGATRAEPAEAEQAAPTPEAAAGSAQDVKPGEMPPLPELPKQQRMPELPKQQRTKTPTEMVLEDFQLEVEQYLDQVSETDLELRTCVEEPDPAVIESCLSSLKDATVDYLANRDKAHMSFRWMNRRRPELRRISDKVQAAVGLQNQQIASTNESIENFDYEHDLQSGCRKMVGQTGKLMETSHYLRDTLDEAQVEVARHEQRLDELAETTGKDASEGLSDRAGLEAHLAKWWENDPGRVRKLYLAMIDVDHFGRINEQYGHQVGDRILHAIAQFLESEKRAGSMPVRLSGQRFLFLFPDFSSRDATNTVERIRQSIEIAHFHYRDVDIRVTVSCAVVEAGSADTSEKLIARAEATLQEAKRYGRNRTFTHQGKYPTPLVPPNLSIEEKEITL